MSFVKLGLTSAGVGAAGSSLVDLMSQYVSLPVWGVPVTVVMAALAGATLSLFFGDPVESRRSLVGQVLGAMGFGTAIAVLVADGMSWEWATKNIHMFALMSAAIIRWFLPTTIDRGKQLIREFKFSITRKSNPPPGDQK